MKPGRIAVQDYTFNFDHAIIIKGISKESIATCWSCPEDYVNGFPGVSKHIASGTRNHVNRQVRIHKARR